jgi:hypothetical protein
VAYRKQYNVGSFVDDPVSPERRDLILSLVLAVRLTGGKDGFRGAP